MTETRTPSSIAAGLALILLPLVAWGFKFMSLGWLVVIVIMGPILVLLVGYILQIVIAAQGFLSKCDLFGITRTRATIAAWASSIGVVLFGIFVMDGGDSDYGSTFQVWLGAYGPDSAAVHERTDTLTSTIGLIALGLWIVGFLWLLVEWIIALVRRRRTSRVEEISSDAADLGIFE